MAARQCRFIDAVGGGLAVKGITEHDRAVLGAIGGNADLNRLAGRVIHPVRIALQAENRLTFLVRHVVLRKAWPSIAI